MTGDRRTRTDDDDAPGPAAPAVHAYLVRAVSCDRPTTPPARWSLAGVSEVVLSGAAAAEPGVLPTDDPWASSRHAVVKRSFGAG